MPPLDAAVRAFFQNALRNNLNSNVAYDRFLPPFGPNSSKDPGHLAEGNWMSAMDDDLNDMRRIIDNGVERWLTPFYVYHRKVLRYLTLPPGPRGKLQVDPTTRVPGGRTKLTTIEPYFNLDNPNANDTANPPRLSLRYLPNCDKHVLVVDLNQCDIVLVLGLKRHDVNAPNVIQLEQMSSLLYVDVKSLLLETLNQRNGLDGVAAPGAYYNENYVFIEDNHGPFHDTRPLPPGVVVPRRALKRVAKNTTANGADPRFTFSHSFRFTNQAVPGGPPITKELEIGICGMMFTGAILMGIAPVLSMLDPMSGRLRDDGAGAPRISLCQVRISSYMVGFLAIYINCWRYTHARRILEISGIRNMPAAQAASVHCFVDMDALVALVNGPGPGLPNVYNALHGDGK